MDKSNLIVRGQLAGADTFRRIRAAVRKAWSPEAKTNATAPAEYLYVPCARVRYYGMSAQTRRWVQEVPIVKKTDKWIYYTSDSWDRLEAAVSPGCISRQEFETDTRCRDGYPAGVIPIPGHRSGPAGRLFFATRQAAEDHLYRRERERAEHAAPPTPPIKELRRAMADAHPDRGGTAEQFIQALRRYQAALRADTGRRLETYTDATAPRAA
jgi:hypothetical protein